MAVISNNTFDPLRRYVGVRLAQGVPIVDADANEQEDISKFEIQAFVKWFIGDGVPAGLDSFSIEGMGLVNDFFIRAGTENPPLDPTPLTPTQRWENGLRRAGRILVNGLSLVISGDVRFAQQSLHADMAGSATLAIRLGVPPITMPAPAPGTLLAYVDAWERLVMPTEDPALVHPGLGVESCARVRREWAVRVRDANVVPQPGDPDYLEGHSYYALARINRRADSGAILASDVTDLRRVGVNLANSIKTPLFARQGTQIVDPARYNSMLRALRESLFFRLVAGELPHTTATPQMENVFLIGLQQLIAQVQIGEAQIATRNMDTVDALTFLRALYDGQKDFVALTDDIGDVGSPPPVVTFMSTYNALLDGSPPQSIPGLKPALDMDNLVGAVMAQEQINNFLAAPGDALPEGNLNVFYVSVTPFEAVNPGTAYVFTFDVQSLVTSTEPTEQIDIQVTRSAASWSAEPSATSLTMAPNEVQTITVTVTPNAGANQCVLTVKAVAHRNASIQSPQAGLDLTLGGEPPIGGQFLFYGDDPLNVNGELEIARALITLPAGRTINLKIKNDSLTEARTYAVTYFITPDTGDVGWQPPESTPTTLTPVIAPGPPQDVFITVRAPIGTPAGVTGTITAQAKVTAINNIPVPDGAEALLEIMFRLVG